MAIRKENTTLKSMRLDDDLIKGIEAMAIMQNRNFTNMVETILRDFLDSNENQ